MAEPRYGEICTLPAHWQGAMPQAGDFLMARGGYTAYEILEIKTARKRTSGQRYPYRIIALRRRPTEIPAGAAIHEWRWDVRR